MTSIVSEMAVVLVNRVRGQLTVSRCNCHGMAKLVKVHRKDQLVNKNAYFYYFGQFRVFL